jgi:hypothetical protein
MVKVETEVRRIIYYLSLIEILRSREISQALIDKGMAGKSFFNIGSVVFKVTESANARKSLVHFILLEFASQRIVRSI